MTTVGTEPLLSSVEVGDNGTGEVVSVATAVATVDVEAVPDSVGTGPLHPSVCSTVGSPVVMSHLRRCLQYWLVLARTHGVPPLT